MNDPLAFFITVTTYGTWLPGDERGWIEYHKGWQLPDPIRELEAAASMKEDARILTPEQRAVVEKQVQETCTFRKWVCHAVNCRTNHMHVVVAAFETKPKKIRVDLKAWCTRRLKERSQPPVAENWWAERGSIRWIFTDEDLHRKLEYVNDAQDRMDKNE